MNPTTIEEIIALLAQTIPAIVGAYKAIAANASGAPTIDALLADADSKWAQIQANSETAIAADRTPSPE